MNIRLKLFYSLGLLILLSIVVAGWLPLQLEENALRKDAELKGRQTLEALAIPCAVPLSNRDLSTLDNYVAGFTEEKRSNLDFLWLAVLDTEGQILAHTETNRFQEKLLDPFTQKSLLQKIPISAWNKEMLQLSAPISIQGLRFGTLRAEMKLERLETRLSILRMYTLGFIVLGVFIISSLLFLLMSRLIIRPVRQLAETASRLGSGDLQARIPKQNSKDELAMLGEVFNQMASSLQEQTEDLEKRVEERTQELKQANVKLARLATTDELTGLFNHRYFQETLQFETQRTQRNTGPLSLLMIDVDYFKCFNDTHGHPAGDKLLKKLAEKFQENLRTIDLVARYGGEEFAVVLLDTDKEDAIQVAEKLRAAICKTSFPGGEKQPEGKITISIGVATLPEDAQAPDELISKADQALYQAKHAGRNQVYVAGQET